MNDKDLKIVLRAIENEFYFSKDSAKKAYYGREYFEGRAVGLNFAYYALTKKHLN